ncbi:hypothetical protein BD779DRAFT_1674800 [Infundibulicybe gibba]|nr:hypothetical protein BD779DRAFT_1674800 [Infundibulicybe gibba]
MALTDRDRVTWGVIFEGTLYGAYTVLFVTYMILWRRNNRAVGGLLALAQILLFSLCTLCFCLDISVEYLREMEDVNTSKRVNVGSLVLFSIIDYLAQMILVSAAYAHWMVISYEAAKLYRCWIVWGRRWVVVAVPGFFALVSLGGELAFAVLENRDRDKLYFAIVNALATSLIVTKIFLTSQEVNPLLGRSALHRSLRVVVAILIESGLLTLASQLVLVVLFAVQHPVGELTAGPTNQIYGITPTLLNIRVVMGSTYSETTGNALSLRFARSRAAATQTIGPSSAAAQSRGVNTELNDGPNNERAIDTAV